MSDVTLSAQSRRAPAVQLRPVLPSTSEKSQSVRRVLTGLTVLGFVLPVAAYFWFIHNYGVNMIWYDQWWDVSLIQHSYSGTLSLGNLWAQHGENRIFFQNLIVLLLAYTTHLSIVIEEYLGGAMLVIATGLLILAHRRRSPLTPWIYYCPVALVFLSFVQEGSTLFGFAIGWYMVVLALAGALFLLDRPTLNWPVLTAAIGAAVVGSFSSLYGLFIWPTGLALLCLRRRPRGLALAWIACAVATCSAYFYNFNFQKASNTTGYVFTHPLAAIKFFFFAIGDLVGVQIPNTPTAGNDGVLLLGVVIFAVATWVVIAYGLPRDESGGSPIGVALVCFGLLFAAAMTTGRAGLGLWVAGASHYTTFDLLILIGCYLALLNRPTLTRPAHLDRVSRNVFHDGPIERLLGLPTAHSRGRPWDATLLFVVRAILVVAIGIQVALGMDNGLAEARGWHNFQEMTADVTVNINRAPDGLVLSALLPDFRFIGFVRQLAHTARTHDLSLFATSAVTHFTREGLPPDRTPPVTTMISPNRTAKLKGISWLNAGASDNYGVTKVAFRLTGETLHDALIGTGTPWHYGWLGAWNTATVPNGRYTLESIAYDAAGNVGRSAPVAIDVVN